MRKRERGGGERVCMGVGRDREEVRERRRKEKKRKQKKKQRSNSRPRNHHRLPRDLDARGGVDYGGRRDDFVVEDVRFAV